MWKAIMIGLSTMLVAGVMVQLLAAMWRHHAKLAVTLAQL